MATRAARSAPDWRAALRRSFSRTTELLAGGALVVLALFLALAMVSYNQTDGSFSTAAGSGTANWMGVPGAYAADGLFLAFGPVAVLILPLLWVFARRLWQLADHEEVERPHWARPLGILALAMVLIATVMALLVDESVWGLPAGMGGLAGLAGSKLIYAMSGLAPSPYGGWVILALAVMALLGGAYAIGRVFALDWASMLTLPFALRRERVDEEADIVPER